MTGSSRVRKLEHRLEFKAINLAPQFSDRKIEDASDEARKASAALLQLNAGEVFPSKRQGKTLRGEATDSYQKYTQMHTNTSEI